LHVNTHPKCRAAVGRIHPVHLRIIEDETHYLSDADAATADAVLAEAASGMTFSELRHAARKLILKLDPDAARKRKEAARGQAHVRPFRESSGSAGMVARELPPDEVLASWQHVEQRALDLRAAGLPGTLRELRIRAYLDLLQERDSRHQPAAPAPAPAAAAAPAPAPASAPAGQASVPDQPRRTTSPPLRPAPAPALTAPAGTAARPVPLRLPARAWPRWSPSPSPGPPTKAGRKPRRSQRIRRHGQR
jgi:Domain of unknown function (DUF222)